MDLSQWSAFSGIISFCILIATILITQKRFDKKDFGQLSAAFFGGANIPPAIFLCAYSFLPAYRSELQHTHLAGYEKYISFAGLASLVLSLFTLYTVLQTALKKEE